MNNRLRAFLVLELALLCSTVCFSRQAQGNSAGSVPQAMTSATENDRLIFRVDSTGSGTRNDGFLFTTMRLSASDGGVLDRYFVDFSTSAQASRELSAWVSTAEKTLRKTPQMNERGRKVGDRILAIFPGKSPESDRVKLIWNVGPKFRAASANSLDLVMEFERQQLSKPVQATGNPQNPPR
jgi:hypothetical protein